MGNRELFYVLAKVAIERKLAGFAEGRAAVVARKALSEVAGIPKQTAGMAMSGPVQKTVTEVAKSNPAAFSGKGGRYKNTTEAVKSLMSQRKLSPGRLADAVKS